ncbi:hypothetical protein F6X56_01680 (plasmid) [Rhodococcus erythropolis]|nr:MULTISPECIES: hypothetical protein [Rhodococcus erythropolis group]MCQ4152148.1 hypothetical protein [Rhodococcus qingshengii]QEX08477.1 hypothetical protein F6X56_01680 [Rhodococcus erythropolis]
MAGFLALPPLGDIGKGRTLGLDVDSTGERQLTQVAEGPRPDIDRHHADAAGEQVSLFEGDPAEFDGPAGSHPEVDDSAAHAGRLDAGCHRRAEQRVDGEVEAPPSEAPASLPS